LIGRKREDCEQKGRIKGNGLGERERKVSKKERAKEMDWEKGRKVPLPFSKKEGAKDMD